MYTKFFILDIRLCFTKGKNQNYENTAKFQNIMTSFVDKIFTIRQTSTRYYFLNWVFKYVKLNSKVVNIIQCLHGQQLYSFINPICTAFFMLCTATCFFARVDSRYYTITNHLTQIFMCATVNVKTLLPDFFYLCICNYQLSSSLSGHKFCFVFLCTCVYKISKFTQHLYQNFVRLQKQDCSCTSNL